MVCRFCDYDPCMCGRNEYESVKGCRFCDATPCICGRNIYLTDKEHKEKQDKENKDEDYVVSEE